MISIILFLESLGTGELMVILLFVLFFFGSKKIPDLARGLGRGMREVRDAMQGIEREIKDGVNLNEEKKMVEEIKRSVSSPALSHERERSETAPPPPGISDHGKKNAGISDPPPQSP